MREEKQTQVKTLVEYKKDLKNSNVTDGYEDIDVLKDYKTLQLEQILKNAITMKYKISFSKGMMMLFESIIMLVLLTSIALKSNIFSLIYLMFVFRYPYCQTKHHLFARLCFYISISLTVQYLLYLLNMTSISFPQEFPTVLEDFPFK
tara:strand:+ start:162 stop:605 length:444 start_codon:yes stop_codon:yes gene_type:complete